MVKRLTANISADEWSKSKKYMFILNQYYVLLRQQKKDENYLVDTNDAQSDLLHFIF